jgi:hypothetical protein
MWRRARARARVPERARLPEQEQERVPVWARVPEQVRVQVPEQERARLPVRVLTRRLLGVLMPAPDLALGRVQERPPRALSPLQGRSQPAA